MTASFMTVLAFQRASRIPTRPYHFQLSVRARAVLSGCIARDSERQVFENEVCPPRLGAVEFLRRFSADLSALLSDRKASKRSSLQKNSPFRPAATSLNTGRSERHGVDDDAETDRAWTCGSHGITRRSNQACLSRPARAGNHRSQFRPSNRCRDCEPDQPYRALRTLDPTDAGTLERQAEPGSKSDSRAGV